MDLNTELSEHSSQSLMSRLDFVSRSENPVSTTIPGKTGVNPFESSQYSPAFPFFRMPLVNLTTNHEHCSKYDVVHPVPEDNMSRTALPPSHISFASSLI